MNIEIERRWVIPTNRIDHDFLLKALALNIDQTYMTQEDATPVIRVRTIRDGVSSRAVMTVKSPAPIKGCYEIEFEVPLVEALAMQEMSRAKISKIRYVLAADYAPGLEANAGLTFEVDIFSGPLQGICIAECEYDGSREIVVPSWFGSEILGKDGKILSNLNMSFNPGQATITYKSLLPE